MYENVELPLLYLGVSSSERKERVNDVLEYMASSIVRLTSHSSYPVVSSSVSP